MELNSGPFRVVLVESEIISKFQNVYLQWTFFFIRKSVLSMVYACTCVCTHVVLSINPLLFHDMTSYRTLSSFSSFRWFEAAMGGCWCRKWEKLGRRDGIESNHSRPIQSTSSPPPSWPSEQRGWTTTADHTFSSFTHI